MVNNKLFYCYRKLKFRCIHIFKFCLKNLQIQTTFMFLFLCFHCVVAALSFPALEVHP